MKNQKKQFVILGVILIVCIAAFVIITQFQKYQSNKEEEENTIHALTVDEDTITGLSYIAGDTSISLSKDGDNWISDSDADVDIDEDTVSTMTDALKDLVANDCIDDPEDDSEYGLDDPQIVVTLKTEDTTYTISFGDVNSFSEDYYMKVSGDDKVYTVSSDTAGLFTKTIDELSATASGNASSDADE